MPDAPAVNAERLRDLRGQVAGLGTTDMPEILFQHISPGREKVTVYSTKDGCPVLIPSYMVPRAMELINEDGTFRFVADAKDAPTYKPGTVKCFLHKDSPERPILEMVGLSGAFCTADALASEHSKRMHGLHRHKQEFAAWQEFVETKKEEKREARQEAQLEATLNIARTRGTEYLDHVQGEAGDNYVKEAAGLVADVAATRVGLDKGTCDICGKTGFKRLKAHKSMVHKEA